MFGSNLGNGVGTMVIVVLAIIVVLMGVVLWAKSHPTGKVAADLKTTEADAAALEVKARAAIAAAGSDLRAAEPTLTKMGTVIRSDAERLLEKAEAWITDTSAEDASIAKLNEAISVQQASKANKQAMGRAHVEKLQAALTAATGS